MENRKKIEKAQKAPKPQETTKPTFCGTMVAAEFFGFPKKQLAFTKKNQLFLGKKLVFGSRGIQKTTSS